MTPSVVPVGASVADAFAAVASSDEFLLLGDNSDAGSGTGLNDGVKADAVIPSTGDFSVEAWIYPDSLDNASVWHQVLQQSGTSASNYGRFGLNLMTASNNSTTGYAGVQVIYDGINLNTSGSSGVRVYEDRWTHIAVTVDWTSTSATIRLYLDGVLKAEKSGDPVSNSIRTADFTVGYFPEGFDTTDRHFHGGIDQVKVWQGVLSGSQIAQSMNSFSDEGVASAPTLRTHLDFNGDYSDSQGTSTFAQVGTVSRAQVVQESTVGANTVLVFPRSLLVSDGGWTVPTGVSALDYLIVGGGGGGSPSGGGGAGGLLFGSLTSIADGVKPIVVGTGGAGGAGLLGTAGFDGGNSSAFGLTSVGGGGAGANDYSDTPGGEYGGQGRDGGSGGGGGAAVRSNSGGDGTDGQGFAGGSNYATAGPYPGGGGGGAGGAGGDATSSQGGSAGPGSYSTITGTSVGYAGGGAGTSFRANEGSAGTSAAAYGGGVGADPSGSSDGGLGASGRGGGGGGALSDGLGGAGGNGVVILRYVTPVIPGAVQNLSADTRYVDVGADDDSVTLRWDALTAQTPAVTSYEIEYSTSSSFTGTPQTTTVSVTDSAAATPNFVTLTDLDDGERYHFRIKARNSVGLSASFATTTSLPVSSSDYSLDFNKSITTTPWAGAVSSTTRVIPNGNFTFEAWIRPSSKPSTWQTIFFQGTQLSDRLALFLYDDNTLHIGRGMNWANITVGDLTGQWSHVAITGDGASGGSTFSVYLNGFLVGTGAPAGGAGLGGGELHIGIDDQGRTLPFDGDIDQVKIWSSQLSQTQLQDSMHTWDDADVRGSPTLISHYDFNDNTQSNIVRDMQGSNDLTLSNAAPDDFTSLVETPTRAGYDVFRFPRSYLTAAGGWSVPAGVTTVDALVVGGGGGGAGNYTSVPTSSGGAGGGGGVYPATSLPVSGTVSVVVGVGGRGGKPGAQTGRSGLQGGTSQFSTITAGGGGGGGCESGAANGNPCGAGTSIHGLSGTAGGNGGSPSNFWNAYNFGSPGSSASATVGGRTFPAIAGKRGGYYSDGAPSGSGGSGSGGGAGGQGSSLEPGSGVSSSISGSTVYYGGGGFGRDPQNNAAWASYSPAANSGFGGKGAFDSSSASGFDGQAGVVVIAIPNLLNVTWNSTGGSSVAASTVLVGGNLEAPTQPTRSGYTFAGWSTTNGGSPVTFDYSHSNTSDFTMYAVWTAVYFEATGDAYVNSGISANSSTGSSSALLLKNAVNSTSNSYNRVAYAEFSFDPSLTWSGGILELVVTGNSSGGGSAWNSSYTTFNVNVYGANDASWNESTLTFNSADASTQDWGINTGTWPWTPNDGDFLGTISIPTSASTVGNTYALSTAELDAFLNDDADGAVTLFFVRSDTDSRGNLTFASKEHGTYAGPTLKLSQSGYTYTVAYDINGGTGTLPSPGTFTDGSGTDYTVASPSSVTAPTNKVFTSWNTKADGTGTSYSPGASYNTSRSVTLYAIYATSTFTVTYAAGDNGSGSSQTATKTSGVNLTLPDSATANSYFSRAGHTVTAWSTNADGSTTDYALGGSYSTNAADTLYPVWTIDTYDIVFASGDDASGSSQTDSKTYNVTFTIPNSATSNTYFSRTGYTITSWSINSDGSSPDYDFGDNYTTNSALTLYPVWTADTYTVTFNKGSLSGAGGSNVTATKTHDVALTLPNSATANGYFSKTGYTIVGWSVNADGSTTDFSLGGSYTTEAADTLYPVWEANDYTVSYTYNGATGGNSVPDIVYTVDGIQVSLPSPTKTGYTFAGWFSNVGLTTLVGAGGASYTPSDDIRLYAKWTAATFTVVFEYNGATGGNSDDDDQYTTDGVAITLPTPTRDGYSFGGWYSDAGLTTSVGDAGDNYTPSLNLTIYAKWTAIARSVTYDTTNSLAGSAPTDSASYIIGDTVVVKGNTGLLTRTGYTFAGWTVAEDGSGTVLNAGATLTVSTSNITLYPKWSPATFTITYHPNGGAGTLSKTSDSYTTLGTSVTLPTTVSVTKTGYTFAGWALTPTGSAVSSPFTTTADVTLYARWTIKDISYTFAKGVDGAGSSLSAYGFSAFPVDDMDPYGTSVTLPLTDQEIDVNGDSVTDHQFGGWSDGTSIFDAGDPYILGDADVSFVAQWIRVYSVRYVLAGGSLYGTDQLTDAECLGSNDTCTDGQTITLNRTPTRAGYNFLGWEDHSGQVKGARAEAAISSSSYIFTAKWDPIDYSVTFDSAGGSVSIPLSSGNNIGDLITLQSPGTQTGYTFSGWEDSSGVLYAVGTTYRMGASSESFEAQWIPDVYSVTYDWQGGASSTPKVSDSYTVGTVNMTLPTASANGYTRDGYTFSGWSTSPTGTVETAFQPTADDVLYAIWADGNYTLTYDAQGGTIIASSASVARTTSTILPTPTRTNFTLVGWYTAASGGTKIGDAGDTFEPSSSTTLYARWVQDSLYGVDEATLETATTTITADGTVGNDQSASATSGGSSADVVVPGGALPDGTVVKIRYFRDTNRQSSLISGDNTYFFSVLVSWLYGSGTTATVPDTHPSRPIEVTLTNSSIKAGARVYQVIGTQVTDLGVAVADGSVTVELFSDPQLVVAATAPSAPTGVTGTAGDTRAAVSWTAGSSGGSPITGYTVTASPGGATCSTAGTSCTIGSLTNNTAYTFTVRATNALGTSSASQASSSVTPVGANYTVTFNSAGGSAVPDGSFFSGSTVSAPTSPSRSGYSFAGWSTVQGDASTAVTFPYAPGVTSAITLYALWNVAPTTSPGSSEGRGNSAANTPGATRAPVVIPRRVVGPIAPVTPPTLFRAPVVIVPERGFDPDSGSQARVGGLPATVTKSTPAPGGVSVGVGRVQVGITPTNPQPSGGSATPSPASDISVSQGQSARVTGGGLLPGSQLQVWLPGISGNSPRELARIPVNTDGTFESELTFSSRQSETPVAIGRQIVQVTGFDELGNQTIVDMTITIGQGDPAPEPNRSVNALPDLAPGQSLATSAGVPEVVTIEARPDTREVAVVSGEWAFNVAVAEDSGEVQRTGDGATITLVQAKTAAVSGEGFQPGTRVDIWLFSDPTLLGSVTVASDGSFTGEVYLDSRYAVLGDHTLQLQGVGVDGFIKAANLGVVVAEPATVSTDPSSQSLFWIMGAGLIVALAAGVVLLARRRARQ